MTKAITSKVQRINDDAIIALAKKDLEKYENKEKSYELLNWLKEELILRQINGLNVFVITANAFTKCVRLLALFRENNLTELTLSILDRDTIEVKFNFDLTTLRNSEKRFLNSKFDLNLEIETENEIDQTYAHMI